MGDVVTEFETVALVLETREPSDGDGAAALTA